MDYLLNFFKQISVFDIIYIIITIFSLINELNETAIEKVTSQKLSFSMNDQSAIRDLNGLVYPEIDIVFDFRSTATFVSKFSEVNLKLIDRRAEKYSISSEIDLSYISTSEQKGIKFV